MIIGNYVSHVQSKAHNFVGVIGPYIYVDTTLDQEVSQQDLQILWNGLYRGAPGSVLGLGALVTRRVEIVESSIEDDRECGQFEVKLYTFFNILYLTQDAVVPCA